jgi:hypothetical protein
MDLNEIFRAIPRGRELRLSHNEHGIQLRIVDNSTGKMAAITKLIPGEDLLRAGRLIEKVFFYQLGGMNAALDRKLTSPSTKGAR